MVKKILITAGGTGGHLYPAQALAQQLIAQGHEVLFVAGGLNSNRYFDRQTFPFKEVAGHSFNFKNPIKAFKTLFGVTQGIFQCRKIMKNFLPHIVVGFGSYYSVPTLLAAKWQGIPIVLHEANSVPGKANRWFAPYAVCTGIHFPLTALLLKGKTCEVGLPLRADYRYTPKPNLEAKNYFNLDPDRLTLLIFGGSQGADAINQLIKKGLDAEQDFPAQVIHLTGNDKEVAELTNFYASRYIKACVKPFEKAMYKAWQAADIFVGRAGASTIAEAIEFEVPGLLIPYPYATDNHQEKNADFFVKTVKGGKKWLQSELTPLLLKNEIYELFQEVSLTQTRQSIRTYKQSLKNLDLCQLVLKVMEDENK